MSGNENTITYPIKIARIGPNNEIIWDLIAFRRVLDELRGRPFRFVIMIGAFQNGKTSFVSLTLGNDRHEIGNGDQEETDGVYIDGSLSLREISQRWNIEEFSNIETDELLFFVDIEGFGGYRRGQTDAESQLFFTKLATPFISISSCNILMANKNENHSTMTQILETMRLNDHYNSNDNNNDEFKFNLLTIVKNIKMMNNINYSIPNNENYLQLCDYLTNAWQRRFIQNQNYNAISKPLPLFDDENDIFHQNHHFNVGFKFVVNDVLRIVHNANQTFRFNNTNALLNIFSDLCDRISNLDFHSIRNAEQNLILLRISNEINDIYENMNDIITTPKSRLIEIENNHKSAKWVELDERRIRNQLVNGSQIYFRRQIQQNMNEDLLRFEGVNEYIETKCSLIANRIDENMPNIMNEFRNIYKEKD